MKRFFHSLVLSLSALCLPLAALAEEAEAKTVFHIDGSAFVDSLQYMLKGMAGIFLVTALIIVVLLILEKASGKKKEE